MSDHVPEPGSPPVEGDPPLDRIPPLDGVRAIAITLVLLFHGGFGWAGGGFFGVDVFFVLSGFLITGLLVAEFGRSSGIRLKRFWGHRVRRLVPALLALLAAVAAYAVFFAPPDTLGQLRGDAVATLLYGNNWHLISDGTGYFADLNTPRPLLHTWSLSIEEQFYLVWPLVVLVLLRATRSLKALLALAVGGAAASAVAMAVLFGGGAGAGRAYYGTDTRAQALLIGAALAVLLAHPLGGRSAGPAGGGRVSLVRPVRTTAWSRGLLVALGGAGLVVLVWMSVTTTSATHWIYRGGFALVALSAAALVASVALVPASPWGRALSLRPVRYVGAISYGLYLWHWPVFVLVDNARTGLEGWPLFALRAGVSGAVAALSFHLLEMPIRRHALRGWQGWVATPVAVGGTAVLVLAATAGAVPGLGTQSVSSTLSPPPAGRGPHSGETADVPVVTAGTGGPIRALLVGDSEASFLGFGLGPESAGFGVDYAGDGVFGCGLLHGDTLFHGTVVEGTEGQRGGHQGVSCLTQLARWRVDLAAFHPDVVLLSEGEYEVRDQRLGDTWTHIGEPAFDRAEVGALEGAVAALRSTGATVVLLTAVYYHQPEQPDGAPWPEDDPKRVDLFNAMLRRVAAGSGNKVVVEDLNAHLDPGGHYAQDLGGVNIRYADGIHVEAAGAKLAAPWLLTQVARLGAADRAGPTSTVSPTPAGPGTTPS